MMITAICFGDDDDFDDDDDYTFTGFTCDSSGSGIGLIASRQDMLDRPTHGEVCLWLRMTLSTV